MISDKLIDLENIRQQFKQDCVVIYKKYVFEASPSAIHLLSATREAVDKDGFPVPLNSEDVSMLTRQLAESWEQARKKYFERMSRLGLESLTEVKSVEEEQAE